MKTKSSSIPHDAQNHWLMKQEPPSSLYLLKDTDTKIEAWTGVRGVEANAIMRDRMKKDQLVFYYESSISLPHISGIAKVASEISYPDPTAFDDKHKYYDNNSDKAKPKWYLHDISYVRLLKRPVYLAELKHYAENDGPLKSLTCLRRNRLSISPITDQEWEFILQLEEKELPDQVQKLVDKKKNVKKRSKKQTEVDNNTNATPIDDEEKETENIDEDIQDRIKIPDSHMTKNDTPIQKSGSKRKKSVTNNSNSSNGKSPIRKISNKSNQSAHNLVTIKDDPPVLVKRKQNEERGVEPNRRGRSRSEKNSAKQTDNGDTAITPVESEKKRRKKNGKNDK